MPICSDSNSEQNFLSPWMCNASRAGVILDPTFPMLETKQEGRLSLGSSFTDSLNEHFLPDGHLDSSRVYEDELEVAQMDHVAIGGQMMAFKDFSREWARSNDVLMPDEDLVQKVNARSDPLLQKLEQLKELQQQKQEQLKRQQMEQLQRLMEEQKKLLTMVSAQQAFTGFTLISEHLNYGHGHSDRLTTVDKGTPRLPSNVCQNLQNVDILDRPSSSLLPDVQNEPLQKLNDSVCSLPEVSRVTTDSDRVHLNISVKIQNDSEEEEFQNNTLVANSVSENGESELSPTEDYNTDEHCDNEYFSPNCNENNNSDTGYPEDRPIVAGIKEKKQSFEEFLEEQLKLEERRLKKKDQLQSTERSAMAKTATKRPFLKRGEGIARFTNAKSKLSKSKELTLTQESTSEDRSTNRMERHPLQRKTAPSSKEQVSEEVIGIIKKPSKTVRTKTISLANHKVAELRNQNVRNKSSKTMNEQSEDKRVVQFSDFVKGDTKSVLEANKENIMECKHGETGSRVPKNIQSVEQAQPNKAMTLKSLSAPLQNTEFSFEWSFLKRCKSWETEREKENIELDEFLLLEEAAEDISFSSNSSFVQKLLAQDQQIVKGHRMSSTPVKLAQLQQDTLAPNKVTQEGLIVHFKTKECNAGQRYSDVRVSDVSPKSGSKTLEACSTGGNPAVKSASWETSEDENEDDCISNASSYSEDLETTMTSENEEAKQLVTSSGEDNPSYRDYKSPSKNTSRENKSRDIDLDLSDRDEYSSDESTVIENKSESDFDRNVPCSDVNDIEFDDDKSWADLGKDDGRRDILDNKTTLTPVDFASDGTTSIPDKTIKRKVAAIKKGDDLSRASLTEINASAPPTSDLMMKLFPSLKPKQKPNTHQKLETRPNVEQEAATGDGVRSQILKEKLVELEKEIEQFKLENASLAKLRADREKAMDNLRKEVADFEQRKANEMAQIEELKKEEIKKLQKERKVFEKHATAARAIPDKKERDEIQALKLQLADLQEELKHREARWSTTHSRLRNQLETVTKENAELREEVKVMEKVRLEVWKKAEAIESNKKADINGTTLKRSDSISPTIVLKSQIPSPVPHSERSIKMTCRMHSPAKGKPSGRLKTSSGDAANLDTVKGNLAESSVKPMSTAYYNGLGQSIPLIAGCKGNDEGIQGEISYSDGKVEKILKNGCHVVLFPNGTRKEASADGKSMTVTFFNGDVKRVMPDQTVIYYFADAQTTHTTYPDGLEVLHFSNGQIEKHYPDGKKEITFPDQTVKNLFLDGREESIFPDGTIIRVNLDGSKMIEFDNGQRELHTAKFKRREYPDGTVKTVYNNGHQETKYTSGRVRVKDQDGNVIMDTK